MFCRLQRTSVDDYFVAICIEPCRGGKVDDRTCDFLGPWYWTSCIRIYLKALAKLSLSGPLNRDGDNGFRNLVNHFNTLDGDAGYFRGENTGCYRIDFSTVSLLS